MLPHLIPSLRTTYPGLKRYLREELTTRLIEQLRAGTLDAVLLSLPIDEDGLAVAALFHEPFVLALPAEEPLTQKSHVREADLEDTTVLLLEDGHCLRDQALSVCGFPLPSGAEVFRGSSLETLRQMVAAGVGCTLLPVLATLTPASSSPLILLRPFVEPVPRRTIGLVWRRGFARSKTMSRLATFVHAHVPPEVTIIRESPL